MLNSMLNVQSFSFAYLVLNIFENREKADMVNYIKQTVNIDNEYFMLVTLS